MPSRWIRLQAAVFLLLLGSYAYFRHARDWNTASRLILTYAIVDRGTVCLDGYEKQTGDIARFRGHYYGDKLPGFSLAAAVPYAIGKAMAGLPPHPTGVEGLKYWPSDAWITLATSGLATALTAVLLMGLARDLGCSPGRAALVGLAYGLATPAYAYATLAYGHPLCALCLLGSFRLLGDPPGAGRGDLPRIALAGFLAAYGSVVELQVGPVSAILGLDLLLQCATRRRRPGALAAFAAGAAVPTLLLLGYNTLAFGSPWEMGYFHHATEEFARVHSRENPLGLRPPEVALIGPLLWGEHRGLLFYAPVLAMAPAGWLLLIARGRVATGLVSLASALAIFLVNLSYPEWTGGWSTGPRLLVPLLPFAMVAVAACLAGDPAGTPGRWAFRLAAGLAAWGAGVMLLCQGVGARIPQDMARPIRDFAWPLWTGRMRVPGWWSSEPFARNLVSELAPGWVASLPADLKGLQFLPLVLAQGLAIGVLAFMIGRGASRPAVAPQSKSDLRVDQQEERRRADEDAEDPEAEPQRVHPDPGP
ncbi:hypothetical protein OJF2_62310 [Aquisphaera giovannonii]|uniref:Glycosyltransferase RgtA/B/C/D-like domain-containing protein n=1 Tax=Aquisphaera giovannonii TaxID=406548 RepID=A0A5B9WCN3_9BACT|nr:hypothetical protein OJF2_62310 [Aquisphaera giovannonii]